jgi:hypothetical protein
MALISIRDQTGVELENCEVLCCDEALFVFKAYSTGHAWDTTALYISVFEQLLKNSSVPAIVVPEGFPKQSVFEALCERFPAAPHGTSLTAEYDFADGWKSYHDYRPTVCTVGVDLYLPGSSAPVWSPHTPAAAPLAPKIAQEPTVAVLLTDQAMCRLMASPNHSQFAFMGRDLARYIGDCIALDQAQRESAVDRFASKFDFERWCRRNAKARAKVRGKTGTLHPSINSESGVWAVASLAFLSCGPLPPDGLPCDKIREDHASLTWSIRTACWL